MSGDLTMNPDERRQVEAIVRRFAAAVGETVDPAAWTDLYLREYLFALGCTWDEQRQKWVMILRDRALPKC
jgi:hypothetical protein